MSPEGGDPIEVTVNVADEVPEPDAIPVDALRRAVMHTLAGCGVGEGTMSLTLLADDEIRAMNERYLGRPRPTDVVAFSLGEDDELIGDVYLGAEQARRQAEELGIDVDEELVRLAVHGTLHVVGYDHPEGEERLESPMFALQERLVAELFDR